MNKLLRQFTYIILGLSVAIFATSCGDDIDDEVTTIETDRLFSPVDFKVITVNQTGLEMEWKAVKNATPSTTYTIEVYLNNNGTHGETPIKSVSGLAVTKYTITGFDGQTAYLARIQATGGEGLADSKWVYKSITTDKEQILQAVNDEDEEQLTGTSVTLYWIPGEAATNIILVPTIDPEKEYEVVPTEVNYTVTAADVAAGSATITGLIGETKYTATLMNGTKERGSRPFTTRVDIGDAIRIDISKGDDIIAILDAAEDGDKFIVFKGDYALGDYAITKSISISGYSEKPVIQGRFMLGTDITSLELKGLVMDGQTTTINIFEASAAATIGNITITNCDFRDYARAIIYNNSSAKFGDISISNCTFTNFPGDGGDGIDFRGGSLKSFIVENSTFNSGYRAFVRMQVACEMAFRNCTFYRVASFNNSNNSGLFRIGGGTLEVSKCLFVETGVEGTTYGNWCKNEGNMKATPTYSQNYYYNCHNLWAGLYTSPSQCSATEADPQFKDPAKGDFTVGNNTLKAYGIGDPRWLE